MTSQGSCGPKKYQGCKDDSIFTLEVPAGPDEQEESMGFCWDKGFTWTLKTQSRSPCQSPIVGIHRACSIVRGTSARAGLRVAHCESDRAGRSFPEFACEEVLCGQLTIILIGSYFFRFMIQKEPLEGGNVSCFKEPEKGQCGLLGPTVSTMPF